MIRVKRGITSRKRHKKILKISKGYRGSRSRSYRSAFQAVIKAGQYSYRDRKQKKRKFRQLWICRINAAARKYNLTYSRLINKIKENSIKINRKILSEIILFNKKLFKKIIKSSINK